MRSARDVPRKTDAGPEYCLKRFLLDLPEPLALHENVRLEGRPSCSNRRVRIPPRVIVCWRARAPEGMGRCLHPGAVRFSSVNRWRLAVYHPSAKTIFLAAPENKLPIFLNALDSYPL
jgi:hypothetical protein